MVSERITFIVQAELLPEEFPQVHFTRRIPPRELPSPGELPPPLPLHHYNECQDLVWAIRL